MKAGWDVKPLGQVCRLINGRAYKQAELLESGPYPVLRVGNFFTNNHWYYSDLQLEADKYCDDGDLLYAWSASFGPRIWQGGKVIYHYHIWKVEPDQTKLDRDFLYYFFDWDKELIKKEQGAGTTMIHVSKGSMEARSVPLPPLDEQKRIVAVLDEAFEGLSRARANAEANLADARELFDQGRSSYFSKPSPTWVTNKLSEVCEKITDGTHQTPKYFDSGHVFLSSRNVTSGRIDWENVKFIDDSQHVEMQRRVSPRRGDVLLAKNGTTGVGAIVDRDISFDIYVSLALLRPKAGLLPELLLQFINSSAAKQQFNGRLKGSGVPNLHLKEIREVTISYPADESEQRDIVTRIEEVLEAKAEMEAALQSKLRLIEVLRQSLLQKAFSGELT